MAINFPSTTGQATDGSFTHTASGVTWAWDGTTWKASGSTGYSLPTAAANVKGGVKIGSGLTMTGETLSASVGATDKIEELNSSVEVIDTGTNGRVAITIDGEQKFDFNETVDGKGGWFTLRGGGASGEGGKITLESGDEAGGISFFNPKTGSGTTSYDLPTAYPTANGQVLSSTTAGAMSWVTQSGGSSGVTVQDEGNALSTAGTTLNFVGPNVVASGTGAAKTITVSAALDGRSTFTATTASIADGASDNISVTAHKSYMLLKIKPSIAAWVVLYVDDASRTADASRTQGADPAPDAGVIAEVVTTAANQEIKMSPGVLGWHQDGGNDAVDTVFCKVVNKSGSTGTCTVSLTVVQLEA